MKAIISMGKACERCNRGGLVGNNRSKSNTATKRKQQVNLQTKRLNGKRQLVCTRCIRTAAKSKV